MRNIEIFDPAMCCSTGICGPGIDPELLRVAAALSALEEKGAPVKRHNLASEPQDFVANEVIAAILEKEGAGVLPVTLVDGEVAKKNAYPTNAEFAAWAGAAVEPETTEPAARGSCGGPSCCC